MRLLLAIPFGLLSAIGSPQAGILTVEYELRDLRPSGRTGTATLRFPVSEVDSFGIPRFTVNQDGFGLFTMLSLSIVGGGNTLLQSPAVFGFHASRILQETPPVVALPLFSVNLPRPPIPPRPRILTGPARSYQRRPYFFFPYGRSAYFFNFSRPGGSVGITWYDFGQTPDEGYAGGANFAEVFRTFEPAPEATVASLFAAAAVGAVGLLRWRTRSPRD